jgi:hypothetical protein
MNCLMDCPFIIHGGWNFNQARLFYGTLPPLERYGLKLVQKVFAQRPFPCRTAKRTKVIITFSSFYGFHPAESKANLMRASCIKLHFVKILGTEATNDTF